MNMGTEEHAYIAVQNGELEVDQDGHVWRVAERRGVRSGGTRLRPVARRRAEWPLPTGYMQTRTMIDWTARTVLVHRLVWRVFFGPIPDGMQINHKNGVKNDNRPANLELVTPSGNATHAFATGLRSPQQELDRLPARRLSDEQVRQIRVTYAGRERTMESVAVEFGISLSYTSQLIRGDARPRAGGPKSTDNYAQFQPTRGGSQ